MSWSGGKDSSYALHKILQEGIFEIKYLLSTFNGNYKRLSMHGVRESLIEEQARQIGIPLLKVYVYEASNEEYEKQMGAALAKAREEGIQHMIFGDIFLEDLRQYRELKMKAVNMFCIFPIWKIDTTLLIKDFVTKGFRTITCCINDAYLSEEWVGREIDESFINELPPNVDPCGENGEYHSFCFDGPFFEKPLDIKTGIVTYKALELNLTSGGEGEQPVTKGFWYCDLELNTPGCKHELKACPRCGKDFICKPGDISHCGCFEVKMNEAASRLIAEKYTSCLCVVCLEELNTPSQNTSPSLPVN